MAFVYGIVKGHENNAVSGCVYKCCKVLLFSTSVYYVVYCLALCLYVCMRDIISMKAQNKNSFTDDLYVASIPTVLMSNAE